MLTALRTSLRVLLESVMASMFLTGDIDRDRDDWSALSMRWIKPRVCPFQFTDVYQDATHLRQRRGFRRRSEDLP